MFYHSVLVKVIQGRIDRLTLSKTGEELMFKLASHLMLHPKVAFNKDQWESLEESYVQKNKA